MQTTTPRQKYRFVHFTMVGNLGETSKKKKQHFAAPTPGPTFGRWGPIAATGHPSSQQLSSANGGFETMISPRLRTSQQGIPWLLLRGNIAWQHRIPKGQPWVSSNQLFDTRASVELIWEVLCLSVWSVSPTLPHISTARCAPAGPTAHA